MFVNTKNFRPTKLKNSGLDNVSYDATVRIDLANYNPALTQLSQHRRPRKGTRTRLRTASEARSPLSLHRAVFISATRQQAHSLGQRHIGTRLERITPLRFVYLKHYCSKKYLPLHRRQQPRLDCALRVLDNAHETWWQYQLASRYYAKDVIFFKQDKPKTLRNRTRQHATERGRHATKVCHINYMNDTTSVSWRNANNI